MNETAPKPPSSKSTASDAIAEALRAPDGKPIAVKKIVFNLPPIDVVGKDSASGLDANPTAETQRWEITFFPAFRHHRIVYFSHIKTAPPQVCWIHESRVSRWDPS